MDEKKNHSRTSSEESRKKRLAQLLVVLGNWFDKWSDSFPTHKVTKLQMLTYVEALDDLTPEELNAACREANRVAEQFPKPGHIRKGLEVARVRNQVISLSGPPLLQYSDEEMTPEVKAEIEDGFKKLREEIEASAPKAKGVVVKRDDVEIERQKKKLREAGYLN